MRKLFIPIDEAKKIFENTKSLAEEIAPIITEDIREMEPFSLTEKISGESLIEMAARIFGEASREKFLILFKAFQLFSVDFMLDELASLSERMVIHDQIIQILKQRYADEKFTDSLQSISSKIFTSCGNKLLFTEERVEKTFGETFYAAMGIESEKIPPSDYSSFNYCLFEHFFVMSERVKKAFQRRKPPVAVPAEAEVAGEKPNQTGEQG